MSHYGDGTPQFRANVQPIELIASLDLDFFEGNVIKYVSRWRKKDGIKDLYKARDYLQWMIAREERYVGEHRPDDGAAIEPS